MILSFFRAVGWFLPSDETLPYVRVIYPALDAVGMLEQNRHSVLDQYWTKRLHFSWSDADVFVDIWKDVQSVPSHNRPSLTGSEKRGAMPDNKTGNDLRIHSTASL